MRGGRRSKPGRPSAGRRTRSRAGSSTATDRPTASRSRSAGTRWHSTRAGASSTGSSPTRCAAQLANASNMLDVTWEAPDGTITPLDGYLDPYFQEVYLEAESIPIFSKLAQARLGRRAGRLRRPARARGRQVPHQRPELRQGRQAHVQRLPPHRALRGGRLPPRAVRRAGHHALPGVVAGPHHRRRARARVEPSPSTACSPRWKLIIDGAARSGRDGGG